MEHLSLHGYLEQRFSGETTVTDRMVAEAKKEYRKHYQANYQKDYKKRHVQITFRLSRRQYTELKLEARKRDLKTATFAKRKVLDRAEGPLATKALRLLVLRTMDVIEEARQEGAPIPSAEVLGHLEQMHKLLK